VIWVEGVGAGCRDRVSGSQLAVVAECEFSSAARDAVDARPLLVEDLAEPPRQLDLEAARCSTIEARQPRRGAWTGLGSSLSRCSETTRALLSTTLRLTSAKSFHLLDQIVEVEGLDAPRAQEVRLLRVQA
jgi:hypothetical protein